MVDPPAVHLPASYLRVIAQETPTKSAETTFDNNKILELICKQ